MGGRAVAKFLAAACVTCTPCCVAVGLALALASSPHAGGIAQWVEERTRGAGLLPRCDFDTRHLAAAAGPPPNDPGKLV